MAQDRSNKLDAKTRNFLKNIRKCWNEKKKEQIPQFFQEHLKSTTNPYLSVLKILMNVGKLQLPSLGFSIIDEFSQWIVTHRGDYEDYLNFDLKQFALELLVKQGNMDIARKVSIAYFPSDEEFFCARIKEWIRDQKYKVAAQMIIMLELQDYFQDPEIFLLPLILQNNIHLAESVMDKHSEMQRNLVYYLDSLSGSGKEANLILKEFASANGIPLVEAFFKTPLEKFVVRLVKKYSLPSETWPNLNYRRKNGALNWIATRHYKEKTSSFESFRERAEDILTGSDVSLRVTFLQLVVKFGDVHEALYFANIYDVPKFQWPSALFEFKNYSPNEIDRTIEMGNLSKRCRSDANSYYSSKLPRDRIQIVNDAKSFENFLYLGLKDVDIVGIDAEWKPTFIINEKEELAILQIATETNVFIMDVLALKSGFEYSWSELHRILFDNENILKLGFGLNTDIALIKDCLLPNIINFNKRYLDLSDVYKRLQEDENFKFPYAGDPHCTKRTLSKLVKLSLGSELCKFEQCSNWRRRPLREEQIIYAALDAYCLLEVYEALFAQCDFLGICFEDICQICEDNSPLCKATVTRSEAGKENYMPKSLNSSSAA